MTLTQALMTTVNMNYTKSQSQTLTFQTIFFICFDESPLKGMENAFYFILKALFILKIFKFLS